MKITVNQLEQWLEESAELAIFDVREHGEYGEGHLLFAVPLPYSRLELEVAALAPSLAPRVVVYDDGHSGVAERAAARLSAVGYRQVYVLEGGTPAWAQAGYALFEGVNVPSKTFGEQVELERHTPQVTPQQLAAQLDGPQPPLVLDGRPFSEYQKMSIPGSLCCPNGELSVRIDQLLSDPTRPVVINCAGRTRSIIGAETLRALGIRNPLFALENGTQGWMLADLPLEHGQCRSYPVTSTASVARQQAAQTLAARAGVEGVTAAEAQRWQQAEETVYLLDVRSDEEFASGSLPGARHAPGGQLQQATDQYVGVRRARVVLFDSEGVRAAVTASWLRQMGHRAYVLEGGLEAGLAAELRQTLPPLALPTFAQLSVPGLQQWLQQQRAIQLWDVRASQAFRDGHIPGSRWSLRPLIARAVATDDAAAVVIVADSLPLAALAASELPAAQQAGGIWLLAGGVAAWQAAGGELATSPDSPSDAERIDYLFFTHDRHHGNKAAARQYLRWEQDLWQRLQPQERAVFRPLALDV